MYGVPCGKRQIHSADLKGTNKQHSGHMVKKEIQTEFMVEI